MGAHHVRGQRASAPLAIVRLIFHKRSFASIGHVRLLAWRPRHIFW